MVVFTFMTRRVISNCYTIEKMVKQKTKRQTKQATHSQTTDKNQRERGCEDIHCVNDEDTNAIRQKLLQWYDKNKRDLPWRRYAVDEKDPNIKAYAVWVSEIMLQQTQVATVIDYYTRWMTKWPTLQALSMASLEEVNEMWSGLGYYSRGRRLHEGACKVVSELGCNIPDNADDLLKQLPGVGRYTAGAIASIAFNQATGLVDGNVVRVFARLRAIGADSTSQPVTDRLWSLANTLVDPERPGDFNQGLMELGATVCTPKTPLCAKCPLQSHCLAYQQVEREKHVLQSHLVKSNTVDVSSPEIPDIECIGEDCKLCIPPSDPWQYDLGVQNYPRKPKKKAPREERTGVCVLCDKQNPKMPRYLITQRPETGLLANLWEFPNFKLEENGRKEKLNSGSFLESTLSIDSSDTIDQQHIGEVVHIFSHIHQTYLVDSLCINERGVNNIANDCNGQATKWVTKEELLSSAISTAMKKVFKAFESKKSGSPVKNKGSKRKSEKTLNTGGTKSKQLAMDMFFKPKSKT
ncbi:unnamed protein product [Owenia fusiformis]|uniref:Adenine DNA glycosylase n=1 Tax=Owenia fusiformis TaxID=6347 RepID=A0A8J1TR45_OWEFU|nr:unnamed protein product [Owenia fusiformis]